MKYGVRAGILDPSFLVYLPIIIPIAPTRQCNACTAWGPEMGQPDISVINHHKSGDPCLREGMEGNEHFSLSRGPLENVL